MRGRLMTLRGLASFSLRRRSELGDVFGDVGRLPPRERHVGTALTDP